MASKKKAAVKSKTFKKLFAKKGISAATARKFAARAARKAKG